MFMDLDLLSKSSTLLSLFTRSKQSFMREFYDSCLPKKKRKEYKNQQ
jgi:hypothetical protein